MHANFLEWGKNPSFLHLSIKNENYFCLIGAILLTSWAVLTSKSETGCHRKSPGQRHLHLFCWEGRGRVPKDNGFPTSGIRDVSFLFLPESFQNTKLFLFSLDGGIRCSEAEVWGGLLKAKNSCKKKMEGRIRCSLNNRGKETQPKGFNFCKIRETRTKIVDPKQTRPTWSCLQLQCVWMSFWIVFFLITIIPV